MSEISTQDIEALMALFERTGWKVMHLKAGDFDLFLSKDGSGSALAGAPSVPALPSVPTPALSAPAPAPAGAAQPSASAGDPVVPPGWVLVTAPSLGTFYRAPKPGVPMFTDLGASVAKDSELCLIEVMKLFTTLRATATGTVREIYAQDGQLVEYGQPLFLIEPDA
ncbi:acetyl-CoA carboxylase biotin carboxyl carrier protein [Sphingobium estronivorans]|uniref:acetyl-CoA carboxylase biotin carboxyl carrier protein n=1 Tax=Sphingobium estronivorans TaxID=1577690 RepID=UPI001F07B9EA|nr:biotin/lipoyl-containing protein [Sphingobium estronivorans]